MLLLLCTMHVCVSNACARLVVWSMLSQTYVDLNQCRKPTTGSLRISRLSRPLPSLNACAIGSSASMTVINPWQHQIHPRNTPNTDIQGTGAVVTAGFINGLKVQGITCSGARVVFFGAGSSAVGVAHMIAAYMQTKGGLTHQEAYEVWWMMTLMTCNIKLCIHQQRIYMVDTKGLITSTRGDTLPEHKRSVARNDGGPELRVCGVIEKDPAMVTTTINDRHCLT